MFICKLTKLQKETIYWFEIFKLFSYFVYLIFVFSFNEKLAKLFVLKLHIVYNRKRRKFKMVCRNALYI